MNVIKEIESKEIQASVFRACLKLTKDREKAIELRQEVMWQALRKIHLYKEEGKLIHWLRTIIHNTFINQYRKEKRKPVFELLTNYGPSERNGGEYFHEVSEIWRLLETLPDKERNALEMIIDGKQYDEIAEVQNVPMGTVKSRIFHGRKKLAEKLQL